MIESLVALIFMLAALFLGIWLFILLPAGMASRRGRSVILWVLISLLISPILACLLLWVLGENSNR
jgi:hypothetical protein